MWESTKYPKPDIPPPDPQKPYVLNEMDKRFLRTIRIEQDQPPATPPTSDEDDCS